MLNGTGLPYLKRWNQNFRGMGVALTPQVSILDTVPQPGPGVSMARPLVGSTGGITCPAPMVPYAAYIDPAGNYEFPGCQMPGNAPVPAGTGAVPAGTLPNFYSGGTTPVNPSPGGGTGPTNILNVNNPPTTNVALLPNSGQMPKGTGNVSNVPAGEVFRFILAMGGGYATGASLPGCSQTNSAMCDPKFFNTLQDAINYALSMGEIPYQVLSTQEPWDIMNGVSGIDPHRIYNPDGSFQTGGSGGMSTSTLAIIAIAGYFLLRKVL